VSLSFKTSNCNADCPFAGFGHLLFIGQSVFTSEEVKCRLYGPCAVKGVTLNGQPLAPLTEVSSHLMHSSTNFQTPPISVVFLCSCDMIYNKQEVCFLLYLLGHIVT